MLILTRRVGETICIGDDITVRILGVTGNQIRLGVDAPKTVEVHREEIFNKIQQEKCTPGARQKRDLSMSSFNHHPQ